MKTLSILLLALALGGCATAPQPEPINVTVSGPAFPATAFQCGTEPLPPDPTKAQGKKGSAAAHYENGERAWGRACQRKLNSVGEQLRDAGQVARGGK